MNSPINIGINGSGRIGKCIIRALYELNYRDTIQIKAINSTANDLSYCLKYDSIHGTSDLEFSEENQHLKINSDNYSDEIKIFKTRSPAEINWSDCGVDVVMDCTGSLKEKSDALQHIEKGKAKKVIISSPCKHADATIVYGVNEHILDVKNHQIISASSCTTNALAPIIKILAQEIGLLYGSATTIHSYTNDQKILDGNHKDPRRSRACNLSIIPTSSGAAKSISEIIPEMKDKISVSTLRVPTPNVSIIDFSFLISNETSVTDINETMKNASQTYMKNIFDTSDKKLVSIDFNHNKYSSILDLTQTNVIDGRFCKVASWYDNEWAFSCRMLDIACLIKKKLSA